MNNVGLDSESEQNHPVRSAKNTRAGDAPLLDHSYDGIQEFDNPLPGWWKWMFILCCVHSVGYVIWYHAGPGKSELQEYNIAYGAHRALREEIEAKERAMVNEEFLTTRAADVAAVARGRLLFDEKCVSCHGPQGAGLVGPNLTDLYQVHGNSRKALYEVIRDGVIEKGMVPWGTMLSHDQILDLSAFVTTLKGKNISGKAPDGAAVTAW